MTKTAKPVLAGDLVYVRALNTRRSGLALVMWITDYWSHICLVTDQFAWDGGEAYMRGTEWTIPAWRLEAVAW